LKATPSTFEVGDEGTTVAAACWICESEGSEVVASWATAAPAEASNRMADCMMVAEMGDFSRLQVLSFDVFTWDAEIETGETEGPDPAG
jgi:hypothetical protein